MKNKPEAFLKTLLKYKNKFFIVMQTIKTPPYHGVTQISTIEEWPMSLFVFFIFGAVGLRHQQRSISHRCSAANLETLIGEEVFHRMYFAMRLQGVLPVELFTTIVA